MICFLLVLFWLCNQPSCALHMWVAVLVQRTRPPPSVHEPNSRLAAGFWSAPYYG